MNDTPQTAGIHLALSDDKCLYVTDRNAGYVLRKMQRRLTSMESWSDRWNIKIDEAKTQAIYFSHQ
jgi:hypothetical protein